MVVQEEGVIITMDNVTGTYGIEIYVPQNIYFVFTFLVLDVLYVLVFTSVCYLFSPIRCATILNVLGLGEFSIRSTRFYSYNQNSLAGGSPPYGIHTFDSL